MTASRPNRLYAIFHLNLAYSSIGVEARPAVVERCYWPLLELARSRALPLGVEATGATLEAVETIDPGWVRELGRLVREGPCELVGSGAVQLIGPLVPARVNAASLRLGHETYERLLGVRPEVALVNEQAFSAGLVPLYLEAGYRAVVMEWNNPARYNRGWDPALRLLPQRAAGPSGESIPLLWNEAIAFQKLQRHAHGELELAEVLDYLAESFAAEGEGRRALPVYGNDAEIFDYRPGRYDTEAPLEGRREWGRIADLFEALRGDPRVELVRPSEALELLDEPGGGQLLVLGTAEQPAPVKKQVKYNLTRWAVTGRDDLGLNTACHRALRALDDADEEGWKALCDLWASDLRTHIVEPRWEATLREAETLAARLGAGPPARWDEPPPRPAPAAIGDPCRREGRFLTVTTPTVEVRLNCRRGLALDRCRLGEGPPLVGTVSHGYYRDIGLGADFYTGHTIIEVPGSRRATDLEAVEPAWELLETRQGAVVAVRARVPTPPFGAVDKVVTVGLDEPVVGLHYRFDWPEPPAGTVRTGIVTLLPEAFDRQSLFYATHQGGRALETFALAGRTVEHAEPASALVSARHGLGATEGLVLLGDASRTLELRFDPAEAAALPMVLYREAAGQWLGRLFLSLAELDDTRRLDRLAPPSADASRPRSPLPGLAAAEPLRLSVWIRRRHDE